MDNGGGVLSNLRNHSLSLSGKKSHVLLRIKAHFHMYHKFNVVLTWAPVPPVSPFVLISRYN